MKRNDRNVYVGRLSHSSRAYMSSLTSSTWLAATLTLSYKPAYGDVARWAYDMAHEKSDLAR
jgi:hypothetical protein